MFHATAPGPWRKKNPSALGCPGWDPSSSSPNGPAVRRATGPFRAPNPREADS